MSDIASLNREAWNSRAKSYNTHPWQQKVATQISDALRSNLPWISPTLSEKKAGKLLDYACGTGNITLALQPYITSAVGMDISPQMLEVYTKRMEEANIKTTTVLGDLASTMDADAEASTESDCGDDFDIAIVGLGFHHFGDPEGCVRRLTRRLGSGGVVVIVDWVHDGGHGHQHHGDHHHGHQHGAEKAQEKNRNEEDAKEDTEEWKQIKHTIKHHGFDEEGLKVMFEAAGLVDFGFLRMEEVFVMEMNGKRVEKKAFVAKGRKN